MRHRKHHTRLNRPTGHRTATLRNLAAALIEHERIETTATKAKTLRPFVENVITLGKKGTLHHRRQAFQKLQNKTAVHKVFEELGPRYAERDGGYTRVIRSRQRPGDAAEMAIIEFLDRPVEETEEEPEATPAQETRREPSEPAESSPSGSQ